MSLIHVLFAVIVALIWGTDFIAAKYITGFISERTLLLLRCCFTAAVIVPFRRSPPCSYWQLSYLSLVLYIFHYMTWLGAVSSGLRMAVISFVEQLAAPLAIVIACLHLGERIAKTTIFGALLAVCGACLIVGSPGSIGGHYIGLFLILLSTCAWAFYTVMIRSVKAGDALSLLGWVSLFAIPHVLVVNIITDNPLKVLHLIPTLDWKFFVSVLYYLLVTNIALHILWYYLLSRNEVKKVVTFMLLSPVFGVVAALLVLGESITVIDVFGIALVMCGVGWVQFCSNGHYS